MSFDVSVVRATVSRLASLPPGPEPFVSLYLDMRAGSTGTHPGLTFLRGALNRQERAFGVRGAALDSFKADSERIQQYLAGSFDAAHHGVALFACHARGVFEAIPLALSPENQLTVSQSPRLFQMTRFLDDYTTYCVALLSRTGGGRPRRCASAATGQRGAVDCGVAPRALGAGAVERDRSLYLCLAGGASMSTASRGSPRQLLG